MPYVRLFLGAGIDYISVCPLILAYFWGFNKLNRKYQRGIMESSADLEAQLVESLNSISTIKRFGIEEYAKFENGNSFLYIY